MDMSRTSSLYKNTKAIHTPPPTPPQAGAGGGAGGTENDKDKFSCLYILVDAAMEQLEAIAEEKRRQEQQLRQQQQVYG